jgi:YD repeat-containing protein
MVTTTTYDPLDRSTTVVANDVASPTLSTQDVTTTTYYDASGGVIATKDPTGITTRSILNVQGQASQTLANCTDSGTTPTTTPASCVGAGTHGDVTNLETNLTYDGAGAVIASVTAAGRPAEATTETAFDAAGRAVAVKDPRGTISRSFFNTAGQLTKTVTNCTTTGTTIPTDWATAPVPGQTMAFNPNAFATTRRQPVS